MNACRECVFHRVDKENKYYHWCAKDGEDRYNRDNKQVDGYGCACTSFKEKERKEGKQCI